MTQLTDEQVDDVCYVGESLSRAINALAEAINNLAKAMSDEQLRDMAS